MEGVLLHRCHQQPKLWPHGGKPYLCPGGPLQHSAQKKSSHLLWQGGNLLTISIFRHEVVNILHDGVHDSDVKIDVLYKVQQLVMRCGATVKNLRNWIIRIHDYVVLPQQHNYYACIFKKTSIDAKTIQTCLSQAPILIVKQGWKKSYTWLIPTTEYHNNITHTFQYKYNCNFENTGFYADFHAVKDFCVQNCRTWTVNFRNRRGATWSGWAFLFLVHLQSYYLDIKPYWSFLK